MLCQILNVHYLVVWALKLIFGGMTEKDEREQSLIQERRGKGEDLALIQYYYISQTSPPRSLPPDPETLRAKDHNVTNAMNQMII